MKFQDLPVITEQDACHALLRNDPDELPLLSITLALSGLDFSFVQALCVRLCTSSDALARGNALVSLGHLARRYRLLDEAAVRPLIERSLQDPDAFIRSSAQSAADEIHQFLHWDIVGHHYGKQDSLSEIVQEGYEHPAGTSEKRQEEISNRCPSGREAPHHRDV